MSSPASTLRSTPSPGESRENSPGMSSNGLLLDAPTPKSSAQSSPGIITNGASSQANGNPNNMQAIQAAAAMAATIAAQQLLACAAQICGNSCDLEALTNFAQLVVQSQASAASICGNTCDLEALTYFAQLAVQSQAAQQSAAAAAAAVMVASTGANNTSNTSNTSNNSNNSSNSSNNTHTNNNTTNNNNNNINGPIIANNINNNANSNVNHMQTPTPEQLMAAFLSSPASNHVNANNNNNNNNNDANINNLNHNSINISSLNSTQLNNHHLAPEDLTMSQQLQDELTSLTQQQQIQLQLNLNLNQQRQQQQQHQIHLLGQQNHNSNIISNNLNNSTNNLNNHQQLHLSNNNNTSNIQNQRHQANSLVLRGNHNHQRQQQQQHQHISQSHHHQRQHHHHHHHLSGHHHHSSIQTQQQLMATNGFNPLAVVGPGSQTQILTPIHLKKAKLMFFYVRYPQSATLKDSFRDVQFNKNNTAQLVKWFSNFREYYYIQMEKFARDAIKDNRIQRMEDIIVGHDHELINALNNHYNKNRHIELPEEFRKVVEETLRHFFDAIHQKRDTEQSWKKAIYKIIARLDCEVPELFKTEQFHEILELALTDDAIKSIRG